MADDSDDLIVLCNRVEDGPSGVYGSAKEECCECQKQIWLSPGTRLTIEKAGKPYYLVCIACGEKRMRENPSADDKLMLPSAEQWREILKGLSELN
jgi:hypothetical protein